MLGVSVGRCLESLIKGFGLMLGDFGKGLRKQDFTLDRMLSGNGGNSMTGYLNKTYEDGGKTESSKW